MKRATNRNFHLPLPAELYEQLKAEARKQGRPATAIARRAIESWLRRRQASELHEEIVAYARSAAGTTEDLDPALEAAAIEALEDVD